MGEVETKEVVLEPDEFIVLVSDDDAEWLRELEAQVADQLDAEEAARLEAERLRATEVDIDQEIDEELAYANRAKRFTLSRFAKVMAVVLTVALPFPVYVGWSYYSLPLHERAFHQLHEVMRPSGTLGLLAGIFGTALILSSLIYLVQKRMVHNRIGLGSLRGWMSFHIVTGLIGPGMVVIHTGFLPTSSLGILATAAMLIVVTSGIIGRYVLTYMPRAVEGSDSGREEVKRRFEVYRKKLVDFGLDPSLLPESEDLEGLQNPSLFTALFRVLYGDRESRREFRALKDLVRKNRGLGREARLELILVRRLCRERQLLVRYHELRRIVGTWRFLHRWLAVVLLFGAFFHILVAVKHGDLWVFDLFTLGAAGLDLSGGLTGDFCRLLGFGGGA